MAEAQEPSLLKRRWNKGSAGKRRGVAKRKPAQEGKEGVSLS